MGKLLEWLDGKKTILGSIALFVTGGAYALKWIDEATFEKLAAVIGAWTVLGLRHAIGKLEK